MARTPAPAPAVVAAAPVAPKPAVKPAAAVKAVPAAATPAAATPAAATPKAAAKKPVSATPVVPEVASASEAVVEEVVEVNPFEAINALLAGFQAGIKETQAKLKSLSKDFEKMKKAVEKTERKRANARTNPNGFAKPTKIVDELCTFCGVAPGSLMSRTDVTRFINGYIKTHNLNKPENKRIIVPDDKLRGLLKLKVGDEVNYFKMQTYISPLFIKETPVA